MVTSEHMHHPPQHRRRFRVWAPACVILLCVVSCREARAQPSEPVVLAESGSTAYSIVIARAALDAERYAAEELAAFLKKMTGAEFPVRFDDEAASDREIVIGHTKRMSFDEVDQDLKSDLWEGFSIVRRGPKLLIFGNIPRATLYGVYDFLDVELGVRFLTSDVTHVPNRPTLMVNVASRSYGPVIEYRTIWEVVACPDPVRNRMNGYGFQIPKEKMLGGVRWVGRPVHTFASFVPAEEYFDSHPEYFSLIDGMRVKSPSQLCLTNPDVFRLTMQKVRAWTEAAADNPYTKFVVSVTPNDHGNHCACGPCAELDRKANAPVTGSLVWFVNRVAAEIADERPNVLVETLAYQDYEQAPSGIELHPNVLIRFAPIRLNFGRRLDNPAIAANRRARTNLAQWSKIASRIYVWNYYTNFADFLSPYPNLRVIDHDFRTLVGLGMRGLFAQNQQSRGTQMQALRCYLLARLMWRPDLDGRAEIEEFCRLYYGEDAGGQVVRYIDLLHDEFDRQDGALSIRGGFDAHRRFTDAADAILAGAEQRAPTPTLKQRVATARLPIWKTMLDRTFGEAGRVIAMPREWSFRREGADPARAQTWAEARSFEGWSTMPIDTEWKRNDGAGQGAGWYATAFELPQTGDAPLALYFGAVDGRCDVYLDGEKIGEQKLPRVVMRWMGFFVPIPEGVEAGRHVLSVRVEAEGNQAGIHRPVSIVDLSAPIGAEVRVAAMRFEPTARAAELTHIGESYGGPHVQTDKVYYPNIQTFLEHRGLYRSCCLVARQRDLVVCARLLLE